MEDIQILDVTRIEPRLKHPQIFEKFDLLEPNQSFIIYNDHDPKPLYYQLLGERGKVFTWDYIENGPEFWKVKIGKLDMALPLETIGDMVRQDYRKAQVFKNRGIDFCCGGKKTLDEACVAKGIDIEIVRLELAQVEGEEHGISLHFDKWDLIFLCDYIVNTHHTYVKESIPFILELANKVAKVHGERHPEIKEVVNIFNKIASELSLHMMKEERLIFPYIKELVGKSNSHATISHASFGTINSATALMEMEHEQAGEGMAAIRNITVDYALPTDACTSYTILYKKLQEFENDLFNHVHLENNILFPKAIILEKG